MWVVGVIALIAVVVLVGQAFAKGRASEPGANLWDLPRTTGTYTSIVGMLAGFTVVITMFFANLTVARASPEFETVIGMLLLAFLLFVASAMQFGTTPNLPDRHDEDYLRVQRVSYQLANLCYFCAIAVSWLSLKLFLEAIGLPYLAGVFVWILFFAVFSGAIRMAQFTYRMSALGRLPCLIVPFLGFGAAALYRLVLVPRVPELQPPGSEAFLVSVVLFVIGAAGFVLQSAAVMLGDVGFLADVLRRRADRLLLAHLQAVTVAVALLWLAVSVP